MSVLVTKISEKVERRAVISVAFLAIGLSFALVGPSNLLNIPDNLILMTIGLMLVYSLQPFLLIPLLPDMTEYAQKRYHSSTHETVNNMCSGIFNSVLYFGNALGSMIGSILDEENGF